MDITKENFQQEVLQSEKPVLVDFWATWCGPCRMMTPVLEELAAEKGDALKVCKINVDNEPELAEQFGVMSIPTFILFHGGNVASKTVGAHSKADLVSILGL